MDEATVIEAIARDPRYRALVRRRGRFAAALTGVMLLAYVAFLLLVAFDKALLAAPVAGGATSVGIPLGLGVILLAVALTALYVRRANRVWDVELAAILADHAPGPRR